MSPLMPAAQLLMVDDDAGDVTYARDVFAEYRIRNQLVVVPDDRRALAYLLRQAPCLTAARPDLVLLSVNLFTGSGLVVIDCIQSTGMLRSVAVAAMSASAAEELILRDRGVMADCFLRKPIDFDRLAEAVRRLDTLAFQVERQPAQPI